MNTVDYLDKMARLAAEHIDTYMTETNAAALGLDERAGYTLYVDKTAIAVHREADGRLQYYGGFEYVDKEFRSVIGGFVFYTVDGSGDCRVQNCIEYLYNVKLTVDEEDEEDEDK